MSPFRAEKKAVYYVWCFVAICLLMSLADFDGKNDGPNKLGRILFADASKKSDILFLKGKFILKDKKGTIVISDEKKCHCPQYYR